MIMLILVCSYLWFIIHYQQVLQVLWYQVWFILVWGLSLISGAYDDSFALDFSTTSNCSTSNTATKRTLADPNLQDNHQASSTNPHNATNDNVVNTEHRVYCPICNNQFPIGIIEEHANRCLERKNSPLISHQFHDDSEESETDKQYSSGDCHVNVNKENIPSDVDGLSRRIQIIIQECGMLRENILQLNIRRGFCFQDFVKAFRKVTNI